MINAYRNLLKLVKSQKGVVIPPLLIAAIAIAIIPIIATLVSNRETQISQEPRAANLAVTTPVPTSITIQQDSIVPPTSNLTTAKKVLEWTSSQKSSSGVYLS